MSPPHKNIRLLNIYNFLMGFLPIIAVIVPFYHNQIGLTFQEFLIGEAIFAAIVVGMEIPSGWISDIWKRKQALIIAAVIETIGMTVIGFADGFWMAVLGQALMGVGVSLTSGTTTALLYDTLLEEGREEEFRKREGTRAAIGLYSVGFASLIGGFLYEYDPYLPVWVSAATYAMCVPVAMMMSEPGRHKEAVKKNPFYDMVQVMKYALRTNKEIAALIFFTAVLYGSTQTGMWMQQPYYIALNIPEMWFGVFASLGFLVGGMGSQLGHFLEKYMRPVKILACLWLTAIVCWVVSGGVLGYHALILMMISNAAWGVGFPVMQDALNKRVDSSRRATVLSVASLMIRFVFIPLGIILGWVVDTYGVQNALLALAGFVFIANILNVRKLIH